MLFDTAHKQVAGQADWIIDSHAPIPMPTMPTRETDWSGGVSAWGFDLYTSSRYVVLQLPTGTALTWGGGGAGDLRAVDVFVSDEPETDFSASEQQAMLQFAQAGGGLLLISDHSGAVRCGTCTEAWRVINSFLETGASNQFGVKCDGNDVGSSGLTGTVVAASAWAPHFAAGPFGAGSSLVYHSGSTVSLVTGTTAAQLIVSSTAGGMMAASTLPGGGRLVLVGDSSPAEDGTCACTATLHNGWGEGNDRQLLLNATAWLAHDGS